MKTFLPSRLLVLAALILAPVASRVCAANADFDEAPTPVKAVAPSYPVEMRRAGVAGLVTVTVTIDENGDVVDRAVAKATRAEFEQSALDAVGKWKFRPARKGGANVKCHVNIPIKFSVDE